MNLFHLDLDPVLAAQANVDRHCVKIITEANQLLATVYENGKAPYKWTHVNHPMAIWVRESKENFDWTVKHCEALCSEYTLRYGKFHKGENILNWYKNNTPNIPSLGFTKVPRCFGEYKNIIKESDDHVTDYRLYYLIGKKHLFSWKNRKRPDWIS